MLCRPNTAISELGSTINEDIQLLLNDATFLDHEKVSHFIWNVTPPLGDLLTKFHRDYTGPNTDEDKTAAGLGVLDPSDELRNAVLQAIEVGGALFTTGTNLMVANQLLANPVNYANLMLLEYCQEYP